MPDLPLTEEGRAQARALAGVIAQERPTRIQSSPVQRARETAAEIAAACGTVPVEIVPALDEIDFGDWTGRSFASLEADPLWRHWNERRSEACAPGGESMADAQRRAVDHVGAAPAGTVVMVTHCDVIRAVLAAFSGRSLDRIFDFDVEPASITRIERDAATVRVVTTGEIAA